MMRTTPHPRVPSAAWILAVVLVFGGIADAGPAVLCIGEGGHTDVEYSLAGCCVLETDDPVLTDSVAMIASRPGCDDCVDLGLDQDSLVAGKKLLPAPEAAQDRLFYSQRETLDANAAASQCDAHESLTTVLSSTVLLI